MDGNQLRKKLSTYQSDKGQFRNVSEELLFEVLRAWEEWPGTAKDFYKSIGFSHRKMAGLIGKAKRLKREGYFGHGDFAEVKVDAAENNEATVTSAPSCGDRIEMQMADGKVIRFPQVSQLMEFLEKVS